MCGCAAVMCGALTLCWVFLQNYPDVVDPTLEKSVVVGVLYMLLAFVGTFVLVALLVAFFGVR